ncbi:MAG: DUF1211 domain-containing protein [Hyphomicrobiales bacterium]|nr:DUF1211 domain-containing protein [Hyphomicrobiales bacterium]MDE2018666.1 DUF1211 domain-containing protein [Hyphomicrobiales bacterium]
MDKDRLNAFTDGVFAVIITIMVLELKPPTGAGAAGLLPSIPIFLAYVLSFVNVGIYWVNHHHMLHAVRRVDGASLLANLFLLFWLSLAPFVIRWIDEAGVAPWPVFAYGVIMFMAGVAYSILQSTLIRADGPDSKLKSAVGDDRKGKISVVLYVAGLALSFVAPYAAAAIYVAIGAMWLVPDRRIERHGAA